MSIGECRGGLYARYYKLYNDSNCYVTCFECLDEHLSLTALIALASYLELRSIAFKYGDKNVKVQIQIESVLAGLAGLLHDIAKSFDIYQKLKVGGRMSFSKPPHEELSARVFETLILDSLLNRRSRLTRVWHECFDCQILRDCDLCYYVYIPIRYHHQGLRTLQVLGAESIYERELKQQEHIRRNRDRVLEALRCAASTLLDRIGVVERLLQKRGFERAVCGLKVLAEELRNPESYSFNPRRHCKFDCEPRNIEAVRVISGSLIIADYAATILNLSKLNCQCISEGKVADEIKLFLTSNLQDVIEKLGVQSIC